MFTQKELVKDNIIVFIKRLIYINGGQILLLISFKIYVVFLQFALFSYFDHTF